MPVPVRRLLKISPLLSLLLAASAAVVGYATYSPVYEATAWVRLRTAYGNSLEKIDRAEYLADQKALITCPPVLAKALANLQNSDVPTPSGRTDPSAWLLARLSVQQVGDSNLLAITLRVEDTDSVAGIVNAVKDAYLAFIHNDAAKHNDHLLSLLVQEKDRKLARVEQIKSRLKTMIKDNAFAGNATHPSGSRTVTNASFSMADFLKQQIAAAEVEIVRKEAALGVWRKPDAADGAMAIDRTQLEAALDQHPEILKLNNDRSTVEEDLANFLAKAKPNSPGVERKSDEVAATAERLRVLRETLRPQVEGELRAKAGRERDARIDELQQDLEEVKRQKEILGKKLAMNNNVTQIEVSTEFDIELVQGELRSALAAHAKAIERIEEVISAARRMVLPEALQDALDSQKDVGPGPVRRAAAFGLAGFLLPYVLCLALSVVTIPRCLFPVSPALIQRPPY